MDMTASFLSTGQEDLFDTTVAELRQLGYNGELSEENYRFSDYFDEHLEERTVPFAAFGQTPPSYTTACFGVLLANGTDRKSTRLNSSH